MIDRSDVLSHLERADRRGWTQWFKASGRRHGRSPALLMGVASRESNMGQVLVGDNGNAITLMQINRRFHGGWTRQHEPTDHRAGIDKGAEILTEEIQRFGGAVRPGVAAYNTGHGSVEKAIAQGLDVDVYTTGGDYSKDVLQRAEWIAEARPSLGRPSMRAGLPVLAGVGLLAGGAYAMYQSRQST